MPDIYTQHIPEIVVPGRRLGRHVRHDPRSLRYLVATRPASAIKSVTWDRAIPVLDQGDLGSCTGNAAEGAVGTSPLYAAIPTSVAARPGGDADADEQQAISLYSAATQLDDYDGGYPPDDTGSDGLSVAKAAQAAGLISGYQHCTSLDAVLTALQTGPVITGVNWYEGMDEPDGSGLVHVTGNVRGGHEFVLDGVDVDAQVVWATNSWGTSYGVNGRFCIGYDDYTRLLSEEGDATVFVPLSQPAPTPTPDPSDPSGCLTAFVTAGEQAIAAAKQWLAQNGS